MTVIGCVYGAYRRIVASLGDEAPSYEWCEQQWRRLSKHAPGPATLPEWLDEQLSAAWSSGGEQLTLLGTQIGDGQ